MTWLCWSGWKIGKIMHSHMSTLWSESLFSLLVIEYVRWQVVMKRISPSRMYMVASTEFKRLVAYLQNRPDPKSDHERLAHWMCHPEWNEGSLREILRSAQNDTRKGPDRKVYECSVVWFSLSSHQDGGVITVSGCVIYDPFLTP